MDKSFEFKGRQYQLNKINAFKQFHIVRRMAPLLKDFLPAVQKMTKDQKAGKGLNDSEEGMEAIASLIGGIGKLSDEDADKVLFGLLESVEVKQGAGNWARIANNHGLMMEDLDLPELLHAAGRAFMFNLQGFFGAVPQVSPGG